MGYGNNLKSLNVFFIFEGRGKRFMSLLRLHHRVNYIKVLEKRRKRLYLNNHRDCLKTCQVFHTNDGICIEKSNA